MIPFHILKNVSFRVKIEYFGTKVFWVEGKNQRALFRWIWSHLENNRSEERQWGVIVNFFRNSVFSASRDDSHFIT